MLVSNVSLLNDLCNEKQYILTLREYIVEL